MKSVKTSIKFYDLKQLSNAASLSKNIANELLTKMLVTL